MRSPFNPQKTVATLWKTIARIQVHHIAAICMAGLGHALTSSPNVGVVGWIHTTYGITGDLLGVIMILCALLVVARPSLATFVLGTTPLTIYLAAGVVYYFRVPGAPPAYLWMYALAIALLIRQYATQETKGGSPR